MIPELIVWTSWTYLHDSCISNLVISGDGIIILTMISRYFQVWNNIDKKFAKSFCYRLIFCNYFSWNYFLLTILWDNCFLDRRLDFVFILSVKNGFTVSQKVLLSVMSLVLIFLKKFFFSLLIKLTEILRCLLYAFLSMLLFVFKNLFLHDFFVYLFIYERRLISSNIPLFYGSMSLNSFF